MTENDVAGDPGDVFPRPDPTRLTTQQLRRELAALREIIEGRLDAMDRATILLSETVHRTPTEMQTQITHLKELLETRIAAIENISKIKVNGIRQRFDELDARFAVQNQYSEKALATALAAARELGDLQNKGNAAANAKTEQSVSQQLAALSALLDELRTQVSAQGSLIVPRPETDAWRASITDKVDSITGRNAEAIQVLAARLDRGEGTTAGASTFRTERRLDTGTIIAALAALAALASVIIIAFRK